MIRQILLSQKQEIEQALRQKYVARKIALSAVGSPLIKVVIGPRRAGKSFFSEHWAAASGPFGYINFDDERLVGVKNYDELTAEVMSVYGSPELMLMDEVQNLPRWELWVNRLQRQGKRIIVTGSNAHLLGSDLATHLTGRHEKIILFPFSFAEYKEAKGGERTLIEAEVASFMGEYLQNGGFPETLFISINRKDYLTNLFESAVYKDIVKRYRITATVSIENLGRYLLSNTGSEYSYRSLTRVVGCKSDMTVRKYLRFLEEAFILFSVPRFSFKVREQAAQNKKIYSVDNGFITAIGFNTSPNLGHLAENVVAVALEKRRLQGSFRYYFWKNTRHEEVDFVCMENGRITRLIQVCWNLDNPKTADRELRSLIKAGKELKCDNLEIVTDNVERTEDAEWFGKKASVRFVPLWKWLLNEG